MNNLAVNSIAAGFIVLMYGVFLYKLDKRDKEYYSSKYVVFKKI